MTTLDTASNAAPESPATPEDAAAYLSNLMAGKADAASASRASDTNDEPAKALAEKEPANPGQSEQAAPAAEPVLDAANAVIASKDGKYVIGFEKLAEAREGRTTALARVAELEAQLLAAGGNTATTPASPEAAKNAAIAAQAIESGTDVALFGDFSEEAIAGGVNKLVEARVDARMAEAEARIDAALSPLKQQQVNAAQNAHFSAIFTAHPDADALYESKELGDWIKTQPSFAQAGITAVLETGSAPEIIEVFNAYKASIATPGQPVVVDAKQAAKAAVQLAASSKPAPASLSDIPGGRSGATDRFEVIDAMPAHDQLAALMRMPQVEREQYMNR